jgi:hypothetical protein
MLLWGLLYAIYLIAWRIPSFVGRPITPLDKQPPWRQVMGAVLVFVLVMLAWVPFRMDLPTALSYWRTMLLGWAGPQITDPRPWVLIALTLGLDWLHLHGGELAYLKWPLLARAGAIALALLGLFIALTADGHHCLRLPGLLGRGCAAPFAELLPSAAGNRTAPRTPVSRTAAADFATTWFLDSTPRGIPRTPSGSATTPTRPGIAPSRTPPPETGSSSRATV